VAQLRLHNNFAAYLPVTIGLRKMGNTHNGKNIYSVMVNRQKYWFIAMMIEWRCSIP
jgi:hypothetical protein